MTRMFVIRFVVVTAALCPSLWHVPAEAGGIPELQEVPSLSAFVAANKLPPITERVPAEPEIVNMRTGSRQVGRHGGDLRLLLGKQKDTRMLTVYGYSRLVCFTPDFELHADILKKIDVEDNRIFTFHLRRGHKWSDGNPFTAEDFRYYWDDIANNADLSPFGPPKGMTIDGETPKFEVIDEVTVRYSWSKPNPSFFAWLAAARPPSIYRPAHYLKRFHLRYGDQQKIAEQVRKEGRRNWADLHKSRDRYYRADNPDRPTLHPWVNIVRPPSERFVFVRNPYYHRIDPDGRQLPYIDRVIVTLGAVEVIPARTGAGESDLQARYIRFDHYTFLKKASKRNDYSVLLWKNLKTAHKALLPNLNATDPVWRKIIRDVRFRRALSIAIDRHEINQVIYFGLANESGNTVLPGSPLYRKEYQEAWAQFDLRRANALLDEMGLVERDSENTRLLPDGRPMQIIVDTAGESTEETDILELVSDNWSKLGVKLFIRPSQREVFRKRVYSGISIMAMWAVTASGHTQPNMSPREFVPSFRGQYHWSKWGEYYETGGKAGETPDLPKAQELVQLHKRWQQTTSQAEQRNIWHKILKINADQVFTIGIVNGTLSPVVVNNRLRNVPKTGVYHWDPGAYFGIYKPDTFWFDGQNVKSDGEEDVVLPHSDRSATH